MRLLLLFILTFNLLYSQKIALIIGNSDYPFKKLHNPLHDVDAIYNTLIDIGFKKSNIKILKNVSKAKMETALAEFSQKAYSSDIALIYFSGHGMQVKNTNYMLPARTNPKKPVDLFGLVNLDYMIQSATSAKYGIVLVDACRNNPLSKYFDNNQHKGSNATKGLGQVNPTSNQVVIGFATSAGDTAEDGKANLSPYAKALKKNLKLHRDITKVLGKVSIDVKKATNNNQKPILRTNLADDVCLTGSCGKGRATEPRVKKVVLEKKTDTYKDIVSIGNLMWENQSFTKEYKHAEAINYCDRLTLGGYEDWRLPSKKELNSLLTKKRTTNSKGESHFIRKEFLENMPLYSWFWTADKKEGSSGSFWIVSFVYGDDYWSHDGYTSFVRCVRQ